LLTPSPSGLLAQKCHTTPNSSNTRLVVYSPADLTVFDDCTSIIGDIVIDTAFSDYFVSNGATTSKARNNAAPSGMKAQDTENPTTSTSTTSLSPSATRISARSYLTPEEFESRFGSDLDSDSGSGGGGGGSGRPPTPVIVLLPLLLGVSCMAGIWIFAVRKSRKIVREREAAEAQMRGSAGARLEEGGMSRGQEVGVQLGGLHGQHGHGQRFSRGGDVGNVLLPPPPAYSREPPRYYET
jgi:hypothetical protein